MRLWWVVRQWRSARRCVRVLELARHKLRRNDELAICDAVGAACDELGATARERLAVLTIAGSELEEFWPEEASRMREIGDFLRAPRKR